MHDSTHLLCARAILDPCCCIGLQLSLHLGACCNDNVLHWYQRACLRALCALTQVDTPVRKLLLGIAVTYTALIVVLPFLNVFIQVKPCLIPAFSSYCIVGYARGYTFCSG